MTGSIGESQRRAPRPTEDGPGLDAAVLTELFKVRDEVPRCIRLERSVLVIGYVWHGAAASALVIDDYAPLAQVKECERGPLKTSTRSTVTNNDGLTHR